MSNFKTFSKAFFLLLVSAFMLTSCDKEQAVAPVLTYDGQADHTIRQLLDAYPDADCDSLPDWTIKGIVVSNDEHGNFYKTLVIQDGTAGISINVSNNSLHTRYPIGQEVYVKLNGLVFGASYGSQIIGIGTHDEVDGIPASAELKCIYRNGTPKVEPQPFVITDATSEAEILKHLNELVAIQDAKFLNKDFGKSLVTNASAYTSYEVDVNACKFAINTSKFADASIAKMTVPRTKGTLVGILTKYGTYGKPTYQITIRSSKDMKFQWTEDFYDMNAHKSETLFGWSQNPSGSNWKVQSSEAFAIGPDVSATSWLVSPSMSNSKYTSLLVSFDRIDKANAVELYYTTQSYSGEINSGDWKKVTLEEYSGSQFMPTSAVVPGKAKRIAFRFKGTSSDKAYIKNVTVKGLIQY